MFGNNKSKDVRLKDKEIKELTKNMSRKELKEFKKRQEQADMDRFDDALMWGMALDDNEW